MMSEPVTETPSAADPCEAPSTTLYIIELRPGDFPTLRTGRLLSENSLSYNIAVGAVGMQRFMKKAKSRVYFLSDTEAASFLRGLYSRIRHKATDDIATVDRLVQLEDGDLLNDALGIGHHPSGNLV